MRCFLHFAILTILVANSTFADEKVRKEPERVRPVVRWSGVVVDPNLEKEKPANLMIVNREDLAALWKAWKPKEQVPDIDFESYFVIVVTASKHTTFVVQITVEDDGDGSHLTRILGGEKDIEGFGYGMAVFRRDKVKKLGGIVLPAK
jgi:hypothetical protein